MTLPSRSRIRGALLGAFVDDALGAAFEGAPFEDSLAGRVAAHAATTPFLGYTDDIESLIGVAESLLACGDLDGAHLLATLCANCEPARGYGRGMKLVFRALESGVPAGEVARAAWTEGSWGNGAAVRVAPIACFFADGTARLVRTAAASARLTHTHRLAIAGAVVQAVALRWLLTTDTGLDPGTLLDALVAHVPPDAPEFARRIALVRELWQRGASGREVVAALGHGVAALESVPLALFAFLRRPRRFDEAVLGAIALGGDTDSIGALTGALVGAALGVDAIPEAWLAALEDGPRGRTHLLRLADALETRRGSARAG